MEILLFFSPEFVWLAVLESEVMLLMTVMFVELLDGNSGVEVTIFEP